ncbi:hypothetical protein [Caulobacter sp. DWR1-3-2b1]|uniref:hypothetical protein n=1 Tax=Caulobacter sp. DWR1-3-2b1 TaxID=2804670 RepID=UPI003CF010D5
MKISLLASAALALSLFTACAPAAMAPTPTAPVTEASCAARGGVIQKAGRLQLPTCAIPYADAGKACTDKAQCKGACILEGNLEPQASVTGQCQKTNVQFGCFARVENGQTTGAICID